jgi:hypothetical protein
VFQEIKPDTIFSVKCLELLHGYYRSYVPIRSKCDEVSDNGIHIVLFAEIPPLVSRGLFKPQQNIWPCITIIPNSDASLLTVSSGQFWGLDVRL